MVACDLIDGGKIFHCMDSLGLPLEIIVLKLREKGLGFNVPQFIEAAVNSRNFTREKIEQRLLSSLPQKYHEDVKRELLKI